MLVISPDSLKSETIKQHIQIAELHNKHVIPYFLYSPLKVHIPNDFYIKLNGSGKVVGIATAKYETAENLNLIRPVSYLKELIDKD